MDTLFSLVVETVVVWGPRVGGSLLVVALALLLSHLVRRLIINAVHRFGIDSHLGVLFARSSRVLILTLGAITALGTLGVDVSALVAGLGLTGFALGFALKDTIANLLSGVLILLYRPFAIGDSIQIAGFEGEVELIDLRYTELRGPAGRILIPNSKLFTDPITVMTPGE